MATFKKQGLHVTDVGATYQFTKDQTIIIGIQISNTTSNQNITVSIDLDGFNILTDGEIPVGGALSPLDGKIVTNNLEDFVCTTGGAGQTADVIISYLEVI